MKLSVIKLDGKAAGDVELSDAVFGISDIRELPPLPSAQEKVDEPLTP